MEMPYPEETDTVGNRWVVAPGAFSDSVTSGILGVWLKPGERVEWIWAHKPFSSEVVGYNIVSHLDFSPKDMKFDAGLDIMDV
jgi:hypothetical protein